MKRKVFDVILMAVTIIISGYPKEISSSEKDIVINQELKNQTFFLSEKEKTEIFEKINLLNDKIRKENSSDLLIERSKAFFKMKKYKECFDDAEKVQKFKDITERNDQISLYLMAYSSFFLGKDELSVLIFEKLLYSMGSFLAKKDFDKNDPLVKALNDAVSHHRSLINIIKQDKENDKPLKHRMINVKKDENCVFSSYSNIEGEAFFWSGKCIDGYAEGEGVLTGVNGIRYKGNLKKGIFDDYIEIEISNEFYAKCIIKEGFCEGEGEIKFPTNEQYKGNFIKNKRHGKASVIFADGRKYIGKYENERPMEGYKVYCPNGKETEYFITRSFENGAYQIVSNCEQ